MLTDQGDKINFSFFIFLDLTKRKNIKCPTSAEDEIPRAAPTAANAAIGVAEESRGKTKTATPLRMRPRLVTNNALI